MKPIYLDSSFDKPNAPDFQSLGFSRATLLTAWGFYRTLNGAIDTDHIDLDVCRRVANHPTWWETQKDWMLVLDEEFLKVHTEDQPERDHIHDQLIDCVRIYREAHPHKAIGIYSMLPERNVYGAVYGSDPTSPYYEKYKAYYESWLEHNKQFLTNLNDDTLQPTQRGLASQVDRVFPGIYSWFDLPAQMDLWKRQHDMNVWQAEQYQKPIMPYLCPQNQQVGGFPYYGEGVFAEMLAHSLAHPSVDGVLVYVSGLDWSTQADAPWWNELKAAVNA